jgi:hypothetical protein
MRINLVSKDIPDSGSARYCNDHPDEQRAYRKSLSSMDKAELQILCHPMISNFAS